MSYTTYFGPKTIISESCIWIADGYRRICITYKYNTATGSLQYAASVFRCEQFMVENQTFHIEPTEVQMIENSRTTERRFDIRPVCIVVTPSLSYNDIISTVRREMCHGYGCKGPRGLSFGDQEISDEYSDHGSDSTENSFLSDTEPTSLDKFRDSIYNDSRPGWSEMCKDNAIPIGSQLKMNYRGKSYSCTVLNDTGNVIDNGCKTEFRSLNKWAIHKRREDKSNSLTINVFDSCYIVVPMETIDEKPIDIMNLSEKKMRKIRYISEEGNENYNGETIPITREFFITFKANKHTGNLIYGASISRLPAKLGPIIDRRLIDGHFKTSMTRLEKKPVVMRLSEEFLHQISSKASHREDVMYEIMDNITKRKGGRFILKSM